MIGGRHLGQAGALPVQFTISIDGRVIESWNVPPTDPFFMRFVQVAAGTLAGSGRWARLEVAATTTEGISRVNAAIEQFDLQAPEVPILGFDQGWYTSRSTNPAEGKFWRWTSGRAVARLSVAADVTLELSGESPLRYFDRAPRVVIRAGDQILRREEPTADFTWRVSIPRQALELAKGQITIETDLTYRPIDRGQNKDPRALGLRIYQCTISPGT